MGGSGGGFSSGSINFGELYDALQKAQDTTLRREYETDVASEITKLLGGFERNADGISTHLKEIKNALESDIESTIDLRFGGSVAKHTYVDGLSDVDTLVVLNRSDLLRNSPSQAIGYLLDRLQARFPKTPIEKGDLAVALTFGDISIQLLPAVRTTTGVMIPAAGGQSWRPINPDRFQAELTTANKAVGGKLIPTIKLVKSIIVGLPESRPLTGYHVEAMAVDIFRHYSGPTDYRTMLKHFFKEAFSRVLQPMADITGQSTCVDASELGRAGSTQRRKLSSSLESIVRRMDKADLACSAQQWSEILGGL